MPKPIKTDRLDLRPLSPSDYDFMRTLHSDVRVMKYIGSAPQRTEEQTREAIGRSLALEKAAPLLGSWIAVLRESGLPVGNLILRKPATKEETEGLEIGFSFVPAQWGKGLAKSEASRGIIDYVRRHFGGVRIVALINPANSASRRTLVKLGFEGQGSSQFVDPITGVVLPTEILELGVE